MIPHFMLMPVQPTDEHMMRRHSKDDGFIGLQVAVIHHSVLCDKTNYQTYNIPKCKRLVKNENTANGKVS